MSYVTSAEAALAKELEIQFKRRWDDGVRIGLVAGFMLGAAVMTFVCYLITIWR